MNKCTIFFFNFKNVLGDLFALNYVIFLPFENLQIRKVYPPTHQNTADSCYRTNVYNKININISNNLLFFGHRYILFKQNILFSFLHSKHVFKINVIIFQGVLPHSCCRTTVHAVCKLNSDHADTYKVNFQLNYLQPRTCTLLQREKRMGWGSKKGEKVKIK